jgi:hypothetical protein
LLALTSRCQPYQLFRSKASLIAGFPIALRLPVCRPRSFDKLGMRRAALGVLMISELLSCYAFFAAGESPA